MNHTEIQAMDGNLTADGENRVINLVAQCDDCGHIQDISDDSKVGHGYTMYNPNEQAIVEWWDPCHECDSAYMTQVEATN